MSTGIRVDLTALTAVFSDLRRDVDQGMTPSTHGATGELGDTARFGGTSASGEVSAGATDISYAASIAAHNVGVHIDNAFAIASLIEGAVAGYRVADALASREFPSAALGTPEAGPPTGGSGATADGLTPVFVGPLPAPKIPPQALTPSPHALNWNSYDTPRMWSMVSREVSDGAWQQMHAFRRLSDALNDQHRRMRALRSRLVEAWTPQGAGAEVLTVWDRHTADLESDAMCAYLTAQALGNILETLSDARGKLAKLYETWNYVTSDYLPEWWDHKAELTNTQARVVMAEADKAIADYRRQIAVPDQAALLVVRDREPILDPPQKRKPPTASEADGSADSASNSEPYSRRRRSTKTVPPLPWHDPTLDGPGLAGSPAPTPLSPASPPSLLPIPPGSTGLAPNGGAYVLPGPWSPTGTVLQIPQGINTGPVGAASASKGTSVGGYGIPLGSHAAGQRTGDTRSGNKAATEQWEVARGVEPVIGEAGPFIREESESEEEARARIFSEWFGPVAMPWEIRSVSAEEERGI